MSKSNSEVSVSREAVPAPVVPCDLGAARSALFGLALRITGNRHDAEDALQSAFVRALQHWGGLARPIEHKVNWSAWLRTLVRRLAVDELRRKRRARAAVCDPESLAARPREPIATWRSITEEQVAATLATCPAGLRTIYDMHHGRGMSYRQIGRALNIPLRTVASRLHRARAFIRQRLGLGVFALEATEENRAERVLALEGPMSSKRALLVGINRYEDPRNDLPSCVADAEAFRGLLVESYGFDPADMRMLKDEEATVANVDDGLKWLLAGATASDRLVFYFSGHGYQMLEGDSLEETLVLRDGFYKDDLLSALSQGLPHGTLTMAFDSCHSGGAAKVFFRPTATNGRVEPVRVKCWDPGPVEPQAKSFGGVKTRHRFGTARPTRPPAATRAAKAKRAGGDDDEAGQQPLNGTLLAACSENETASASSSATRGLSAFTFALLGAIEEQGPHSSTTALRDHAEQTLRALGFRQTPIVHAPEDPSRMESLGFITFRDINASRVTSLVNSPSTELPMQPLKETNVMNQMNQSIDTRAINDALVELLPGLLRALQASGSNGAHGGAGQEKFLPIVPLVTAGATVVNVLSGLFRKNKDFEPAFENASPALQVDSASQEKCILALAQLLPVVFSTLSNVARKDFQPVPAAAASDKAIFDTLLRLAPTIYDIVGSIARKDFAPVATAEDKSIEAVLRALMQQAPRILEQVARAT